MIEIDFWEYFLYLVRWQLSTVILWLVMREFTKLNLFWRTVLANLIGGLIFYWIDKYLIFF